MAGRAHVPDITGLKGEDIASYLPNADQFVDLRTLGADKLKASTWPGSGTRASPTTARMIGFPIDIGPVALYYRADVFAQGRAAQRTRRRVAAS